MHVKMLHKLVYRTKKRYDTIKCLAQVGFFARYDTKIFICLLYKVLSLGVHYFLPYFGKRTHLTLEKMNHLYFF